MEYIFFSLLEIARYLIRTKEPSEFISKLHVADVAIHSVAGTEPAIWGVQLETAELVNFVHVTNRTHLHNYSKM